MNEQLTGPHFLGGLALDLWHDDTSTHGRSQVGPHMFVPGTERLRMGVLATLADIAAGIPASGPINPTIDIQVTMLAPPPSPRASAMRSSPSWDPRSSSTTAGCSANDGSTARRSSRSSIHGSAASTPRRRG